MNEMSQHKILQIFLASSAYLVNIIGFIYIKLSLLSFALQHLISSHIFTWKL